MTIKAEIEYKTYELKDKKIHEYVAIIDTEYISKGNLQGCINYVNTHKGMGNNGFDSNWCLDKLGWYEEELIKAKKDISLCTTGYCFYVYADIYNDESACFKIDKSIPSRIDTRVSMQDDCIRNLTY